MTIAASGSKHVYDGDGTTTQWSYTFPIIETSDIQVFVTNLLGQISPITSRYAVDTNLKKVIYPQNLEGQLPVLDPLPTGTKITILRTCPLTQGVGLRNTGPLNSEVLEQEFDKLTMIAQQLDESLKRAVKYPVDTNPSASDTDTFLATILAATNAATASQSAAAESESAAEAAATAAAASELSASDSQSAANTSATDAAASANAAATAETNAANSATTASTAATSASNSSAAASTSETNAANSAIAAASSASTASTAATNAGNSATAAATSQAAAATSETNAAASAAVLTGAIDTDSTFAANSDVKVPSQKAVKTALDAKQGTPAGGTTGQLLAKNSNADFDEHWVDPPNSAVWGGISGTLSSQTDLNTELGLKIPTSYIDTDTALTANSDAKLASQKAVKAYATASAAAVGYSTQNFTGTVITTTAGRFQRHRYTGSSAQIMTAPTLTLIPDAGVIVILGTSDTNTISIPEGLTGIAKLKGPIELGVGNTLMLMHDATLGGLCEISRS